MKFIIVLLIIFIKNILINSQCPFSSIPIKGASATFYTAMDNGNCGFEKLTGPLGPGNTMIAALGTKLYQNGAQCGQCFKITNSNGTSVVVRSTDSCNDSGYCQRDNHFDLSPDAFSVLGNPIQGVLDNLSYIRVPCDVIGNVKIMMKDGSNQYWTSFLIFNSKVLIKQVSIRMSNSNQFTALTQTTYNYWPTSVSGSNFEVKIESIGGEFIYITIPSVESRKVYDTNNQFSSMGCSNSNVNIKINSTGTLLTTSTNTPSPTYNNQNPINSPTKQNQTPTIVPIQTNTPTKVPNNSPSPTKNSNLPLIPTNTPNVVYVCPNHIISSPEYEYKEDDFNSSSNSVYIFPIILFNILFILFFII